MAEETRRPRVLVVDDNEPNRLLVVETLAPEGYDVDETESGAGALERVASVAYDVVLLDVRMPGMDGFETLERLRATPNGASVPVVFLTALRDVDTFDRARAAGAIDFLTKPVRPSELLVRVETLLRMQKLGSEVRTHLDEIKRQRDDLLRLALQKERLSAFVVHDLKNPLASMRLEADVILRNAAMPEEAVLSARAIREQCERLFQLVLNLLDLSRADEGSLRPSYGVIVLADLLDRVMAGHASQAADRMVTMELRRAPGTPDTFLGDRDLLLRMLENLTENALRHAPRGSVVSVETSADERSLDLRIVDRGTGVPSAIVDRIFDPFVQIEGVGNTRSGRGLGLAFCRMAAEAHGGTISLEPSAVGATFVVRLPRDRSAS